MLEIDEQTQTVGGVRLQTFQRTFTQILNGDEPWYPLSEFTHQWFGRYQDYRAELVREPLEVPADRTPEQWRWAVWCVASIEYLCNRAGLECPTWARDEQYCLADPWYYDEVEGEEEEVELREETPSSFARRGIFCEANPYRNKYEYEGRSKTA